MPVLCGHLRPVKRRDEQKMAVRLRCWTLRAIARANWQRHRHPSLRRDEVSFSLSYCAVGRVHAASPRACGLPAVVRHPEQETRPASAACLMFWPRTRVFRALRKWECLTVQGKAQRDLVPSDLCLRLQHAELPRASPWTFLSPPSETWTAVARAGGCCSLVISATSVCRFSGKKHSTAQPSRVCCSRLNRSDPHGNSRARSGLHVVKRPWHLNHTHAGAILHAVC